MSALMHHLDKPGSPPEARHRGISGGSSCTLLATPTFLLWQPADKAAKADIATTG
jgi:hypothetical protein